MEFCPDCGAMLFPKNGVLKCNSCGYSNETIDEEEYNLKKEIKAAETVTNLGEDVDMRSTIKETCPECGHDEAYYELKQTRSADEAPTRIFTCAKCKHVWRAYHWGFFMKDSKEKEHRISNLKDMINSVKDDSDISDFEEDSELIDYLNEDTANLGDLEIDDEFIYRPGDEKGSTINLEENPIDEDFIINAPKEEDIEESNEYSEKDDAEELLGDVSDNFDMVVNAKIGKTPILAIASSILGVLLILISIFVFQSRSDRVIDNVVSGETNFYAIVILAIGILLLIYGVFKIFNIKNPVEGITNSINSIDLGNEKDKVAKEKPTEKIIPKSNIPLDKESYKIGEFDLGDLKKKLKKQTPSKKRTPLTEDIDNIPPAREKEDYKKGLTAEEIEHLEYEQAKIDNESIDDIFAEVEDIDEMPIISIDSDEKKE